MFSKSSNVACTLYNQSYSAPSSNSYSSQGGQGAQGATGAAGVVGDKYSTQSTSPVPGTTLESGDSVSYTVADNLAYIPGNSVLVIGNDIGNYFNGIVTSYSATTGDININVESTEPSSGCIFQTEILNVNLNGVIGAQVLLAPLDSQE